MGDWVHVRSPGARLAFEGGAVARGVHFVPRRAFFKFLMASFTSRTWDLLIDQLRLDVPRSRVFAGGAAADEMGPVLVYAARHCRWPRQQLAMCTQGSLAWVWRHLAAAAPMGCYVGEDRDGGPHRVDLWPDEVTVTKVLRVFRVDTTTGEDATLDRFTVRVTAGRRGQVIVEVI